MKARVMAKGWMILLLLAGWAGASAFAAPAAAAVPTYRGPLYDHPAPGSEGWTEPRETVQCNGAVSIYNTREPQYEVFLPDHKAATGAAVIMLPGGALRLLGVGIESDAEVDAFLRHGIAVLRLEYRTLPTSHEAVSKTCRAPLAKAPPFPMATSPIRHGNANPAPDDPALLEVLRLAVTDLQESLKRARRMASQWGLDPDRIGVVGTSAGGGVAFGAVLADAPADAKPAFLVSIYGPSLQDVVVPKDAPPIFLVTEADHGPVTDGLLSVFALWKKAGRSAELHVYDVPPFSMTSDLWGARLFDWLKERGMLDGRGAKVGSAP